MISIAAISFCCVTPLYCRNCISNKIKLSSLKIFSHEPSNNSKKVLTKIKFQIISSVYLKALWYDAKGNWDEAHQIIQDVPDKNASWIHAYLHRKEGDINNADYWYNQAGRKRPNISLNEEWEEIVKAML
jgi:hypothetical protein